MRHSHFARSVMAVSAGAWIALATPGTALAQKAVFNVKVASEAGGPIAGATVYINDLAISVPTDANGNATLTTPADRGKARSVNLRVRALGFAPMGRTVSLAEGNSRILFELKPDSNLASEVPLIERGRASYKPSIAPGGGQVSTISAQADPFGQHLFPPELVMQYQDAISLKDAQRAALQTAIQEAQSQVIKMQWALALEGEKLGKLLSPASLDEKEVVAQVDRIIMAEREIKRAQMMLLVRIKNTLTVEQQAKLRQLRGGDQF